MIVCLSLADFEPRAHSLAHRPHVYVERDEMENQREALTVLPQPLRCLLEVPA